MSIRRNMDKDETCDAKDSRYPIKNLIKSAAGNPVTSTQLPIIVAGNKPSDKPKVGQMYIEWSNKWFTFTNCVINEGGEVVYTFVTDKTKKTAAGRVVRIMLYYTEEDFMDINGSGTTLWYQIV